MGTKSEEKFRKFSSVFSATKQKWNNKKKDGKFIKKKRREKTEKRGEIEGEEERDRVYLSWEKKKDDSLNFIFTIQQWYKNIYIHTQLSWERKKQRRNRDDSAQDLNRITVSSFIINILLF